MIPFPDKKYQIIYADPPWQYSDKRGNDPKYVGLTYPTMSIHELCDMKVKDIMDENCILFLWVTMPLLDVSFEVLKAWGFKYKTLGFSWIKIKKNAIKNQYSFLMESCLDDNSRGIGHYTMCNTELCLIGVKGRFKRKQNNIKQIIFSARRKHSQKPDETRKRIVDLSGVLPRIELFARNKTKGWDVWGNEV